jgi:hypothetical protein
VRFPAAAVVVVAEVLAVETVEEICFKIYPETVCCADGT